MNLNLFLHMRMWYNLHYYRIVTYAVKRKMPISMETNNEEVAGVNKTYTFFGAGYHAITHRRDRDRRDCIAFAKPRVIFTRIWVR